LLQGVMREVLRGDEASRLAAEKNEAPSRLHLAQCPSAGLLL
jgi:hypothetical protein